MIIDVTTNNTIFNPLSAQGQWFQHRWGKRSYDLIDLSIEHFEQCFLNTDDDITLLCEYGDPANWVYLESACKIAKERLHIVSYGLFTEQQIKCIIKYGCNVVFTLDGLSECGRVYLKADRTTIQTNIHSLQKQCVIEFKCYQHNIHDIPELIKLYKYKNIPIKFTKGHNVEGNYSCIINEQGEWLYDVYGYDFETDVLSGNDLQEIYKKFLNVNRVTLHKSVIGYNLLRTYIKERHERSILEFPLISKDVYDLTLKDKTLNNISEFNMVSVAPTGHVFNNSTLFAIFMRLLSRDWSLKRRDIENFHGNEYAQEVLYCAQYLKEKDLNSLIMNFNL